MASAEELEKAYKAATPGDTAAADTTQAATAETGTPLSQVDRINQMYDAQKQAQLSQLESAYNQSLSAAQEAAGKIPGQYQERGNDLAVQYERNRRNLNEQAAGNGINTGTASQQALALNSVYQRDTGALGRAQAEAEATAQRGIADLTAQYQSSISQAVADNDYKRAAALLDEYNNQYQKDLAQAQTLASYGDFSIYANLYGQEAADNMYKGWVAQNPGLAYNTGRITAEEYKNMTGSYPPGYTPPSTGGASGYGSGWGGPGKDPGLGLDLDNNDADRLAEEERERRLAAIYEDYVGGLGSSGGRSTNNWVEPTEKAASSLGLVNTATTAAASAIAKALIGGR